MTIHKKTIHKTDGSEIAIFAGGCFWCIEGVMSAQDGVKQAVSGYAGGDEPSPSYEQVSAGLTSHREAIQVTFDPSRISFDELLDIYFHQIDPTDGEGQFADRGFHYTPAVYYTSDQQKQITLKYINQLEASGKFKGDIVVRVEPYTTFYEAEPQHQNFAINNPDHYTRYKKGSGREDFIKNNWGATDNTLSKLTPMQYKVTQESGTEPPFDNEYRDHDEQGIYVSIIDGTPLFSSLDKYDAGCGWPSFTKPIDSAAMQDVEDYSHGMVRTEVRTDNAHLGHVFDDGPMSEGGKRYCINSAALRFIPAQDLEQEGYGEYKKLFI